MSLLEVRSLSKTYVRRGLFAKGDPVQALHQVSFRLYPGETLAIVGESGCGKTTLAKCLMGIETPTSGEVLVDNRSLFSLPSREKRRIVQMIFQDPYGSLNPRKRAWQIVAEPLRINTKMSLEECRTIAVRTLERVGLRPELAERYPHMFSGGQRQRIGIARALVLKPSVLICDEPVSALDVSIQAQILNLFLELQKELRLSYLFISHDLSVVRHVADRVLVIHKGEAVEQADRDSLFLRPTHDYTRQLLAAVPALRRSLAHV